MKRPAAILLALALLLALTACGSGEISATTDPADPWAVYTSYATLDEAVAAVNTSELAVTVVDTTDAAATAALDYDFELMAYDSFVLDPACVSELTLNRQRELNGQNKYELGGHLLFVEDQPLPHYYFEPGTNRPLETRSVRIDEDSFRVYPMYHPSFTTRYQEWANETYAELLVTANENPDLAETARALASEAELLLRAFENLGPVVGETYTAELLGHTVTYSVPDEWMDICEIRTGDNTIAFFHTPSVEGGAGGMVFSLVFTDSADFAGDVVAEVDGMRLMAVYPTEAQYFATTMVEYLNMQNIVQDILYTVTVE